jgi:hypothetical protein
MTVLQGASSPCASTLTVANMSAVINNGSSNFTFVGNLRFDETNHIRYAKNYPFG